MRIIDRLRHQALIKNISVGTPTGKDNPLLKKQLEQTQKDLNLILNKWKFGAISIKSAEEFLNNFEPWINNSVKQLEELKEFLKDNGLKSLGEIKNVNSGEESEKLKFYKEQEQLWKNTEQDYLRRIEELKVSKGDSEEVEDLISERDEAIREKRTLEQQNLAFNNQLKNKQQEVSNKDQALEKLKKEKSQLEVQHQKALKEKNTLITTLNQEIKQHKEKYSKQGKLLDTEQLECKRLEEENEKLTEEIKKIKEKG